MVNDALATFPAPPRAVWINGVVVCGCGSTRSYDDDEDIMWLFCGEGGEIYGDEYVYAMMLSVPW